ncbi:7-alpha-hydroxysteroid dehydrogenase [Sphingomonas sp. YR710]|uniref:SDR family NAD(P)-dependent oxidoreductase n=1 Tax=Sphingomonas sp. YR710 TaxID=1882773 RepID=UPI000888A9EB|nr:SDR family oxidoreductase [Sphingomonas sp. YR710]SDC42224.1 7-alpha-hydroxysteroid dehydrogenase [Sphingomonas sp. YR710]
MSGFSLAGKVALVTGSGRGIGAGMARKFAEAGAAVAVTARSSDEIEAVAADIRAAGGQAVAIRADIGDPTQLPGLVERTVAELGGLDILVNNAGGGTSPAFVDTQYQLLESQFHLIVAMPFELARLALSHLLDRPGACIINTLSPGSYKAPRGNLSYYVAKAALAHMTKLMAADLGPRVRVNGIIPGPVETPALQKIFEGRPEIRDAAMRSTRMRRLGLAEDIGFAAVYLASPAAAFVTGALLPVNGGDVEEMRPISPDL